jgi:ribonuclease VapC
MIVVDTSALVAIVFNEPERERFIKTVMANDKALVCTVTALEARMVVQGRKGQAGVVLLNDFLGLPVFELVAPTALELETAYAAFVIFGKGSCHPAQLNFGDLFSYATAKLRNLPLLYKGQDFASTDIQSATTAPH